MNERLEVIVTPTLAEEIANFLLENSKALAIGDVSTPELMQLELLRLRIQAGRLTGKLLALIGRHQLAALDLELQAVTDSLRHSIAQSVAGNACRDEQIAVSPKPESGRCGARLQLGT